MSETKRDLLWVAVFSIVGIVVAYSALWIRVEFLGEPRVLFGDEPTLFSYVATLFVGPIYARLGLPTFAFRPKRLVNRSAAIAAALFLILFLWSNIGSLSYMAFESRTAQLITEIVAVMLAISFGWLLIHKVWTRTSEPETVESNRDSLG